jgi:hypothetical protein
LSLFEASSDVRFRVIELQRGSANPSVEMEALQVAYNKAQDELQVLEVGALEVFQEIEGSRSSAQAA